jgi:hypothetical protein
MAFYIRFLTEKENRIPVSQFKSCLESKNLKVSISLEIGTEDAWDEILLHHEDGKRIALIERNLVLLGSLGKEEIKEFIKAIQDDKPQSVVPWLTKYLPQIKVIYAFQILSGADEGDGWAAIDTIRDELWAKLGGIMQADGEGFSNQEGYHILWQFFPNVDGTRYMAVLNEKGEWEKFKMDLANKKQRQAFWEGKVPEGVERL